MTRNDRLDVIRRELFKAIRVVGHSPEGFCYDLCRIKPGFLADPRDVAYVFDELFRQGLITVAKVEFVGIVGRSF